MFIVTIDGPVASGKSSLCKKISKSMGYFYLNSGIFYRSFAYILNELKLDLNHEEIVSKSLDEIFFEYVNDADGNYFIFYKNQDITMFLVREKIGFLASLISPYKAIREKIIFLQRKYLDLNKNIIADGRDCGEKIFPEANLKFYIIASLNERIKRVLGRESDESNRTKVINFLIDRDKRDKERTLSPVIPSGDSFVIDTTFMNLLEVTSYIERFILFKI